MKIPGKRESRRHAPVEAPAPRPDVPAPPPVSPSEAASATSGRVEGPSEALARADLALKVIFAGMFLLIPVAVGVQALRSPSSSSATVAPSNSSASTATTAESPAPTASKPRVRKLLREPAEKGDAFSDHYELGAVALELKKDQERALHQWAKNPASALPAAVTSAHKANGKALLHFERGARAELGTPRPLNATVAQKAVALGRLALARGRLELEGGARVAACERAFVVVRFGQDVTAFGTAEAAFTGSAIENDGVAALEAWLGLAGWTLDDVKAVRETLARVVESAAAAPANEDVARYVGKANARLSTIATHLDKLERSLREGKTP